ncbi:SpoIIE family protein phosphatase [Geodermatophilus sp. FMUSA9-8]|uniref:SpoIIE family protein phosphatase n=1 Tax=Geodermatophilus sp. FMUSA9-8 TaxID=3120155 RepID=UPI003FA5A37A
MQSAARGSAELVGEPAGGGNVDRSGHLWSSDLPSVFARSFMAGMRDPQLIEHDADTVRRERSEGADRGYRARFSAGCGGRPNRAWLACHRPRRVISVSDAHRSGEADVVRDAYETLPVMLAAFAGPEQRFVAANAAYRAMIGKPDLVGLPAREAVPEAEGQQLLPIVDRVFATGRVESKREWRLQFEQDGVPVEVFLDFNVYPVHGPDGTVTGLNVLCVDVTERVRERQAAEGRETEAQRRYEAARDVVVELQQALLPTGVPVLPGADIAARYLVAEQDQAAGGDWFDAVPLSDGSVALVIGDVVGHGVAASAAMGQLRAVLNDHLITTGDLQLALQHVDELATRTPAFRASTVCVAVLDPASGALRYSTCGHPPPLVLRSDASARYLAAPGAGPLGTGSGPVPTSTDSLAPGELLLLYSDGLVERRGDPLDAGLDRLARVARDAAANTVLPTGAPESVAERVGQQSVELLTREGFNDDVTVLTAQRRAVPIEEFHLKFPAEASRLAELRDALLDWLRPLNLADREVAGIDLAVSELVANAIEHAYPPGQPGPVRVDARLDASGTLRLGVGDDGSWRDPGPTPADTSGRGLWLTGAVLDDVHIEHVGTDTHAVLRGPTKNRATGTVVTVRRRLARPAQLAARPAISSTERLGVDFSTSLDPGPARMLRVTGPVDMATAGELAEDLSTASRGGLHPLVLDLNAVTVLASAGVKVLFAVRDQHAVHDQALKIVADDTSPAANVLDLVGLERTSNFPRSGCT